VQRDIDDFKPGTKIAITEYNYGAGDHISGGVAQADVLGVFGEQGVFAANWWDLGNGSSFANSAFNMYLNYDGAGGNFGDTSILATTSNDASSAVYASVDANDPTKMILVLINRTGSAVTANLSINHTLPLTLAEVYRLTGSSANIAQLSDIILSTPNSLSYSMPAFSVTTLELSAVAGDFDGDRDVDGADFVLWQTNFPKTSGATWSNGDADGDGDVDGADFVVWQTSFPTGAGSSSVLIAEPTSVVLLGPLSLLCGVWQLCRRRPAIGLPVR
jgi:hypothetical protein